MNNNLSLMLDSTTVDFYSKAVAVNGAGNFMLSPINILQTILLVYLGSKNVTKAQLDTALNIPDEDATDITEAFSDTFSRLMNDSNDDYHLQVANGLFLSKGLKIKKSYHKSVIDKLKGHVTWTNFRENPENARNTINSWISDETDGTINQLIAPEILTKNTTAILTSVIHFKAPWKNAFDTVSNGTFQLLTGGVSSAQFITVQKWFKYADDSVLQAKYLEVPYLNSPVSFLIILPKEADGLRKVESLLKPNTLRDLTEKANKLTLVELTMPKFKFETTLDLKALLEKLGVDNLFTADADLSGISVKTHIKITDAVHKTFIDVNENGTEASGASFLSVVATSSKASIPVPFKADHPFLFAIRHNPTGIILFIGRIEELKINP